ncbi:FkbM family methyltransferase [Belnapia sp. T18]|uniref:FkbM family methyltransferase n=1 Tax=Belnapia arida TaxID=2804533 RepID=A0ABS1UD59_9PROT|nr:FkbM family methyltransferase [Belnapia arida]MBL6082589.1 FkbM family methyltransferase [Belnapia arida]
MLIESDLLDLAKCRYGTMAFFKNDNVIGRALKLYGEWAEHEINCISELVSEDSIVFDVGANVGTHTMALARMAAKGAVYSFEAQPDMSTILEFNILLNSLGNVHSLRAVCADKAGSIPIKISYSGSGNFGAFRIDDIPKRKKILSIWPFSRRQVFDEVVKIRLDDMLDVVPKVDFIKIDIEGMELQAIKGAAGLIKRYRPAVFFEQLDLNDLQERINFFERLNYTVYWLETHPFNKKNYRTNPDNIWWKSEMGLLAIPPGSRKPRNLRVARPFQTSIPTEIDVRTGWDGSTSCALFL